MLHTSGQKEGSPGAKEVRPEVQGHRVGAKR